MNLKLISFKLCEEHFLKNIPLISLVLTIIICIITCYSFIVNYYRRPKLLLEPHYWGPEQNVRLLGFIVRNIGRNIARGVHGRVKFNNSAIHKIAWNDSPNYQIDVLPGPLNECWFYVAEVRRYDRSLERYQRCFFLIGPVKESFEITVELSWNYHGLRSLTKNSL